MRTTALLALCLATFLSAGCGDDETGGAGGGSGGSDGNGGGGTTSATGATTGEGGAGGAGGGGAVTEDAAPRPDGAAELFGAPLGRDTDYVAFDALVADPEAYAGLNLQTLGVVRANCTKRGCWMEVRSPENEASPGVTVRFVDYGFFVPLDSRGATVLIEGDIAVEVLSPEEVEHLESEGYDPGNVLPDGSAQILSFTASGVEMWGRL